MRRRAVIIVVVAVAVTAAGLVSWWYLDQPRRIAAGAVRAYDVALSRAVRMLDPELLDEVARPDEQQRVANYITLLWGEGRAVDATLQSLEVIEVARSEEDTITARVEERWRYQDVDSTTGETLGEPYTESMTLTYTIVRLDGVWVVGRSALEERPGDGGSR